MINRCLTFTVLLILCYGSANAQIPSQQHAVLRAALNNNNDALAEQTLRGMYRSSPEAFARNNYDYLLARLLKDRGANSEAMGLFQKIISRNSPLAGYALWHQAEIAREGENYGEEQRLLQRFISQNPGHLLREHVTQRLIESYFKIGQYQSAITAQRSLSGPRREGLALIGEAQLGLRQYDAARSSFTAAMASGSMDDTSLRAARGLDRLDQNGMTALTEAERFQRARIYQFNRFFVDARRHWMAIIRDFPQSSKRPEALFQLGRGYFLEDKFAEAMKWYNQAHDEFPQTDEGEQGFYFAGHCHQYSGNADRAIARYEEFLQAYPESEYAGYAHLNAIDTLRTAGRPDEALKWAARAQANVRDPFIVVTAIFNQARIRLSQENYSAALNDLTALRSRNLNVRGLTATTNQPEVIYLRGYCLEKLGRADEAIGEYLSLPEARSGAAGYYGRRAGERLRVMQRNARAGNSIAGRINGFVDQARAANSQGNFLQAKNAANQALRFSLEGNVREEMFGILRSAYSKLRGYQMPTLSVATAGRSQILDANSAPASGSSHQTLAGELLFLGLYDEGASELAETQPPVQTLAFYCARGDCADRTIKYSEPILNTLPEDYRLELLPRNWAEIFYPMPYRRSLARHAQSRGVDPRFILSIVRQESRYNPAVSSPAAARGMLQFIPATANQIAAQLALKDFEQSDLYHPDLAILFGSQYIKNLFAEFGAPQAVAAAYNGSEDSVRRWRERAKSGDVDRLVIETAKRETKDYLFKVMNFYAAYQKLYPE